MIPRPKKKTLTAQTCEAIISASATQTVSTAAPKSYAPDKYPVFENPINSKVLVYIPNHTVTDANGVTILRQDKFAMHRCRLGRSYLEVRCNNGIVAPDLGLDGTCPFCDGVAESYDLYRELYNQLCAKRNLDPNNSSTYEQVKNDAKQLSDQRAINKTVIVHTFPIVVIECQVDTNGKQTVKPKLDADGKMIGKLMWYTCSDSVYNDKWMKALGTLEEDEDGETPTHFGGKWAVLNYEYDTKGEAANKMLSAQNLAVTFRQKKAALEPYEAEYDELSKDWTPEVAMEFVVRDALRDGEEQKTLCDEVLATTREELQRIRILKEQGGGVPAAIGISADSALSEFGGVAGQIGMAAPAPVLEDDDDLDGVPPQSDIG